MDMQTEIASKHARLCELLDRHALDALVLRRVSSFAWATGGAASHVNLAASEGAAWLLVTRERRLAITDVIEAPRLREEEQLESRGFELQVAPWHAPFACAPAREPGAACELAPQLAERAGLARTARLGADVALPGALDLSDELALARARLLESEHARLAALAADCADALEAAGHALRPGMSEHQIAAQLAAKCVARGVQPVVVLVAVDERAQKFRHPLPTERKLERFAMLVLCGRRAGLVASLTRLVHLGPSPAELVRREQACARIDAAFLDATRPGATLGAVLAAGIEAYAAEGFAREWELHHQGGLAGYEGRERIARPGDACAIEAGMALAWNPSLSGVKSEDTILVGERRIEVLSLMRRWPVIEITRGARRFERPAILEL